MLPSLVWIVWCVFLAAYFCSILPPVCFGFQLDFSLLLDCPAWLYLGLQPRLRYRALLDAYFMVCSCLPFFLGCCQIGQLSSFLFCKVKYYRFLRSHQSVHVKDSHYLCFLPLCHSYCRKEVFIPNHFFIASNLRVLVIPWHE